MEIYILEKAQLFHLLIELHDKTAYVCHLFFVVYTNFSVCNISVNLC